MQYPWFSSATTTLELGFIGVCCKIIGYIIMFFYGFRTCRSLKDLNLKKWGITTSCFAAFCIVLFFYNNSLEDYYISYLVSLGLMSSVIVKKKVYKLNMEGVKNNE